MKPFTENVIRVLRSIPRGKVMSYGAVARAAGSPRGARQVVRILHSMSEKYELPWHRVVNKDGRISLTDEAAFSQKELLASEGVFLSRDGTINMKRYGYQLDTEFFPFPDEE